MVGTSKWPLRILVVLLYIFLLGPILIVVPLSFSNDTYLTFPPESWGIRWYGAMFHHQRMTDAFLVSLAIASIVTVLSLVAGIPAAYCLARERFTGRDALLNLFTAPLLLPTIVLGLSILLVFVRLNLLGTYHGIVIAHLIVTTPYVIRIMITSFTTLPAYVEEAAKTLGASPLVVFRKITLPLVLPGFVASAALSFLLSFDEVIISLFLTGPRLTTLPVEIYNYVESQTDPMAASISVVLVSATMAIVIVIERTVGLAKAIGR